MAAPIEKLATTSLVRIARYLDKRFNEEPTESPAIAPGQWVTFELETITDDLMDGSGLPLPDLLSEKIEILQTLWANPEFFYTNIIGFIAVCDVVNGVPHDFETLVLPNSLEMTGAIVEVKDVFHDWKITEPQFSEAMKEGIAKLLIEDGFSQPVAPFEFVPESLFDKTPSKIDMDAKSKAIQIYMTHLAAK